MEVRKGYKQTEIGVIPNDWNIKPLGKMTNLMTNGFVGVAKIHYTERNDGVLYIQGYNVKENGFNFNGIKSVTPEFHKKNSKSCLELGDLLTVQTGDVGLTTIVPENLVGSNCHALIITRFKKKKYNAHFYKFYLNSTYGRSRLKEIETGTTMKHINVGELIYFEVPVPPIKEQTAIANALSDTDAWINSLEQLLTKKRLIKQGAMQELLQPKEGWELKKLGEILNYIQPTPYLVTDTEYSNDFSIPVLTAGKTFLLGYTSEEFGIFDDLPTIIFDDFTTAIQFVDFPFKAKSSAMKMLVLKDKSNNLKLMFEIIKNIKYPLGDHKRHWIGEYSKIEIKLPKPEEQTRIATILSDMDEEIAQLETKLAKAKQIKQGMMQELLTGRIRLV